jgi:spore maturation protein CgeB
MGVKINNVAQKLKIAFLTSIYPKHVEEIYQQNPELSNKSSDEQMDFIRWHALSSYVRWFELLEDEGFELSGFNHNLPHVALAWAEEIRFKTKTKNPIMEIGKEKIIRFKPDVIFCFAPLSYLSNNYLNEIVASLENKPKVIAWYGANVGDEKIFNFFDLTLTNSKHLVKRLHKKGIKSDFLGHSFDPIILKKIDISSKRINRVCFFGNLDLTTRDFNERTRLLEKVSNETEKLDVYGQFSIFSNQQRFKYKLIETRSNLSRFANKVFPTKKLQYWANPSNLPATPQALSSKFERRIRQPCYGHEMLKTLSKYSIALNYHNQHTGDCACNMRLFEATGVGCALFTDYKSDLSDYFEEGKEVLTFKSVEDLIEKIKFLLRNPNQIKEMGQNAQSKVLQEHTTDIQVNRLSKIIQYNFGN